MGLQCNVLDLEQSSDYSQAKTVSFGSSDQTDGNCVATSSTQHLAASDCQLLVELKLGLNVHWMSSKLTSNLMSGWDKVFRQVAAQTEN